MFNYHLVDHFNRQLKSHQKKYISLKNDVYFFLKNFTLTQAVPLGNNLYKARLFCRSLNKGKSGGLRIIMLLFHHRNLIIPVTLFFKGDYEDISEEELFYHSSQVYAELRANNIIF